MARVGARWGVPACAVGALERAPLQSPAPAHAAAGSPWRPISWCSRCWRCPSLQALPPCGSTVMGMLASIQSITLRLSSVSVTWLGGRGGGRMGRRQEQGWWDVAHRPLAVHALLCWHPAGAVLQLPEQPALVLPGHPPGSPGAPCLPHSRPARPAHLLLQRRRVKLGAILLKLLHRPPILLLRTQRQQPGGGVGWDGVGGPTLAGGQSGGWVPGVDGRGLPHRLGTPLLHRDSMHSWTRRTALSRGSQPPPPAPTAPSAQDPPPAPPGSRPAPPASGCR